MSEVYFNSYGGEGRDRKLVGLVVAQKIGGVDAARIDGLVAGSE